MAILKTSGLRDWILQRISSVLILIYVGSFYIYFLTTRPVYFAEWYRLHHYLSMKIFTFLVLLSVLIHAWIGLWTVFTDYVKNLAVRFILQVLVILLLLAYVIWGIEILWG